MEVNRVLAWLSGIITLLISGWVTYYFSVRLFQRQKRANKETERIENERKKAEIEKIFDDRWKALSEAQVQRNEELERQILSLKDEHQLALQKAKEDCSQQIAIVEENHKAVIKQLKRRIAELEKMVKGVKIDTDKLKKG